MLAEGTLILTCGQLFAIPPCLSLPRFGHFLQVLFEPEGVRSIGLSGVHQICLHITRDLVVQAPTPLLPSYLASSRSIELSLLHCQSSNWTGLNTQERLDVLLPFDTYLRWQLCDFQSGLLALTDYFLFSEPTLRSISRLDTLS